MIIMTRTAIVLFYQIINPTNIIGVIVQVAKDNNDRDNNSIISDSDDSNFDLFKETRDHPKNKSVEKREMMVIK